MEADFDHVIVGGGAAGSVLAARLSEDASRRVLLIEAGPDLRHGSVPPGLSSPNPFRAMVAPHLGVHTWPGLLARRAAGQEAVPYTRGRGLGGSTAVNGQILLHALPEDFDEWRASGCAGWGADDVAAARARLEDDLDFGGTGAHGSGGPLAISRLPVAEWGAMSHALRDAALAVGYGWAPDVNDPLATGVSPVAHAFARGARVSASDAYLEPIRDRENLTIRCDALVDRVLVEDGRAVAVEVITADGPVSFCGREIVLSAGAIATPGILVRSGIGPRDAVEGIGVPLVAEAPVGSTLRDHAGVGLTVELRPEAHSSSLEVRGMNCFVRYSSGLAGAGRNDMVFLALDVTGGREADRAYGYLLAAAFQTFSRGTVRVVSRDPLAHPEVDMGLLSDERDLVRLRDAMRRLGALVAEPAFDRIAQEVLPATRTVFRDTGTGGFTLEQLDDDVALDAWIRATVSDTAHAVGSCPMGPAGDPRRVVDPECRVVGVDGLRVIDASVMPTIPRANTELPTLVVAERMAERMTANAPESEAHHAVV